MTGDDPTTRLDLAAERLGAVVVAANDEFFAPAANLLKAIPPVFIEDRYTDHGKWMDGWETRRRRTPGHDWCVVRLAVPGVVRCLGIDTTHFRGNHPEACAVDGCRVERDLLVSAIDDAPWTSLLERSDLRPHAAHEFDPVADPVITHLRLRIFPDGGVARLRAWGEVRPDWSLLLRSGGPVDLAAARNGGRALACSDMFFSAPQNLIMPGRGVNMGDGWETKRRRGPGHDWCVVALGRRGVIETVEIDTAHFKGNYPDRCGVERADVPAGGDWADATWTPLLDEQPMRPDHVHRFAADDDAAPCTHVRLNVFPDGGVSRLRLYGRPEDVDA